MVKKREVIEVLIEITLVFMALWINNVFMYVLFLGIVISLLVTNGITLKTLWEIAIVSVILPDNYSSLILMIMLVNSQDVI